MGLSALDGSVSVFLLYSKCIVLVEDTLNRQRVLNPSEKIHEHGDLFLMSTVKPWWF
ncbi:hypothetical protein U0070_026903 [Myodes glareolus]|uniref:Uncharacterized protein n=1 Tax=Myodes glareolus TaxID=447135 RepID=A0AAW0K1H1_MYOGA